MSKGEWLSIPKAAKESGRSACAIYSLCRVGILNRYPAPDSGPKRCRRYVLKRVEWEEYLQRSAERKQRCLLRLPVGEDWVSFGEAARIIGVSVPAVGYWLRRGKVRRHRASGHVGWYDREDVLRMAQIRWKGPPPPPVGYIWASDLARKRGVSRQAIHQLIVRERLDAIRVGHRWAVAAAAEVH